LPSITWCTGLLPNLAITHKIDSIIMHPTCSTTHLGLNDTLKKLAAEMAEHVEVPIGTTCCGTAGDRGLLHPELVHSATRDAVYKSTSIQRSDIYLRIGRARSVCIRRLVSLTSRSRLPWKSSHARRHNSCESRLRSYLKEGTRFETGLAVCNGSPSTLP
jgi:hypothetical protein